MNTCPTCSSNRKLSVCNQCNANSCKGCFSLHNPSCSTIKEHGYSLCKQHGCHVIEYCCQCSKLTCYICAESHIAHSRISLIEAYATIKKDIVAFTDDLLKKETELKTIVENAGQNCELATMRIEGGEKRFDNPIAGQERQLHESRNLQHQKDSKTLLDSLNGVKKHLNVLKEEKYPLTFLSMWSSVMNWINEYKKWQTSYQQLQTVDDMSRTPFSYHVGSPEDKPSNPVKVDDIDEISDKLSVFSINDKSHSTDTGQQEPNSAIEEKYVHVRNPNDRSDHDNDRRFKKLKADCSDIEERNKQQKIPIGRLENEIKSRNVGKEKIFEIVSSTAKWIIEMTKSKQFCQKANSMVNTDDTDDLKNFKENMQLIRNTFVDMKNELQFGKIKDEHASLQKVCHDQTIEITDLKKKLKHSEKEYSTLVKTSNQQETEIGVLKKNLQTQKAEKGNIVALITFIEHWTQRITKSKEVCKAVPIVTSAIDTPNLKTCKMKMIPVMGAIIDSTNDLISQGKEITIRDERIKELATENGKLRQQLFEHQKKQTQYEEHFQYLRIENENARKSLVSLNSSVESWRLQCADKEKKIQILQAEKDDLQTRISSIAGEKLAKGNPAITDLSDPNRPMKISEKYGELYDNEWTDAIECNGTIRSLYPDVERSQIEEIIIRHLYKLLTMCYKECLVLSRKQLQTIGETVAKELNLEEEEKNISNIPGYGEVCKFRRQYADMFAEYLVKHKVLTSRMDVTDWEYVHKNADLIKELAVTPFFEKCVHLCWYMAIQDPIMHLSEEPIPDFKYDKNMYKEFVQSGDKVKFVVWPTLFLHDGGPILYKGVVQAYS